MKIQAAPMKDYVRQRVEFFSLVILTLGVVLVGMHAAERAPHSDRPERAFLRTSAGDLTLRLDWVNAPESCAAFVRYAREGIYAKTQFDDIDEHAFFGGAPSSPVPGLAGNGNMACGKGPPGEFQLPNVKGAVGFRRTVGSCNPDKRSNCTQIYVRFTDKPQANGEFTIFSMLEDSEEVVSAIRANLQQKKPVQFTVELTGN